MNLQNIDDEFISVDDLVKGINTNQKNQQDQHNQQDHPSILPEHFFDYSAINKIIENKIIDKDNGNDSNDLVNIHQCRLYQTQGIDDKGAAVIKFIGYSD